MLHVLYGGPGPLVRIVVVGVGAFVVLLVLLRLVGARPLARMQTFDVIFAVAIGSAYGRLLTAEDVQLDEAIVAFALLALLHWTATTLTRRFPVFAAAIETRPILLYLNGRFVPGALRRARLSEREVMSAVRKHGLGSLDDVAAVVLETDGTIAVLVKAELGDGETLAGVQGATWPAPGRRPPGPRPTNRA